MGYLSHSLFGMKADIISLIYKYVKEPNILCLIKDIIENKLVGSSQELLLYFQRLIRDCPTVANLNLTNPVELRKALLFFQSNYYSINTQNVGLFNGSYPYDVVCAALKALSSFDPVNTEDPITKMEIEADDLFTSLNGQCFSLSALIQWHNTRNYRGTEGEQHQKKFLLNPISNKPFSSKDAENIMATALRKGLPPIMHLSDSNLQAPYLDSFLSKLYSPAKLYTQLSACIHPRQENLLSFSS